MLSRRLWPGPWLSPLLFLVVLAGSGASRPVPAEPARPNVLILLTDDQGYGDLSSHGNPVLKTPNLDRLRSQSIRLTDFHSAPMCTPSRGQILTGRDALKNGATSVTAGRSFVRPGIPFLPEIFARNGYRTGLFGKWHLGDSDPNRPMDRGFQEAVYHKGWGFTSAPEFANTLFDGRYFHNGVAKRFEGYCTDFWFDRAIDWMKQRAEAGEPFLCYLPTNAPHTPHDVAERYSQPYRGAGPAPFFGMIANIDENLGRLEAFLESSRLRENTIVVFMTDNGGTAGVKVFNAGMRGHKTEYYEGGHRVPCFVRWPAGRLQPPTDIDLTTQMQDLLPTLLELCGLPAPEGAAFDGRSLAGVLRGQPPEPALKDRILVVQYGQTPKKWDAAVLHGPWRLVFGKELYDLRTDPGQATDVAAAHPEIVGRLRAHYESWWSEVEPGLSRFVPIALGGDRENPVELTCSDWQDVYCDNSNHVRQAVGGPRGGPWNVRVERPGRYRFVLRRWPAETGWALDAPPPTGDGKALPIASAHLTIGNASAARSVEPGARDATIELPLRPGVTRLQAWFQDAQGRDLSGAFFATVTRLPAD